VKIVEPKKKALAEAEKELKIKRAQLQTARDALKKVLDLLAELQAKFDAAVK